MVFCRNVRRPEVKRITQEIDRKRRRLINRNP